MTVDIPRPGHLFQTIDGCRVFIFITQVDPRLKNADGSKLRDQKIADLTFWIKMGASWPENDDEPKPAPPWGPRDCRLSAADLAVIRPTTRK